MIDQEIRNLISSLKPGEEILLDCYCPSRERVEQIEVLRNEIELTGRTMYTVTETFTNDLGELTVAQFRHQMDLALIEREYEIEMP